MVLDIWKKIQQARVKRELSNDLLKMDKFYHQMTLITL